MASKTVTLGSREGLQERPAAMIAEAAQQYDERITLATGDGTPVDAASAEEIMTLDAEMGADVTVESADETAVETIANLVEQDLDAEQQGF